jgi:putative flippase GtrA
VIAQTYAVSPLGTLERLRQAFFSPGARPLRFAMTGGLAGLTQLVLLKLFTDQSVHALPANAAAFLLAAQVNFVLSNLFTWRDRGAGRALWRRWLVFHGSIAGMAVVNMAVFAVARTMMPDLAASVAGICAAAFGNFLIGDHLVFRPRRDTNAGGADPYQDDAAA